MEHFKFRAWIPNDGVFIYSDKCNEDEHFTVDEKVRVFYLNTVDDCQNGNHVQYDVICEDKKAIISMFSSLKDKNGIDIYNGDFVKTDLNGKIWEVKIKNYSFTFKSIRNKIDLNEEYSFNKYLTILNKAGAKLEIIGNIYENPELLKD